MNVTLGKTFIMLALSAFSLSALASEKDCTGEPKANWQTEKQIQSSLERQGYTVRRIKTEGSCYEAKATGKDGRKVELIVNPVDGKFREEGKS